MNGHSTKWRRIFLPLSILFLLMRSLVNGFFVEGFHQGSVRLHYVNRPMHSARKGYHGLLSRQKRFPLCPSMGSSLIDTIRLFARPQDNLVAGISEIGFGFSLGVLWSEYSIVLTGCGPLDFSDTLERICYQGVIALAGTALFNRIVTGGKGLDTSGDELFGPLEEFTLFQVRWAEYASVAAVIGAFVALGFQYSRGGNLDGLSGIDVSMCRAIRDM